MCSVQIVGSSSMTFPTISPALAGSVNMNRVEALSRTRGAPSGFLPSSGEETVFLLCMCVERGEMVDAYTHESLLLCDCNFPCFCMACTGSGGTSPRVQGIQMTTKTPTVGDITSLRAASSNTTRLLPLFASCFEWQQEVHFTLE